MAVIVPIIAAYGAAAAGYTAATVSLFAMGAAAVSTITGISDKINRGASKVFGKDAVMAFNIMGSVYGAMGGFQGMSPSEVMGAAATDGAATAATTGGVPEATVSAAPPAPTTDPTSASYVNSMDAASDAAMKGIDAASTAPDYVNSMDAVSDAAGSSSPQLVDWSGQTSFNTDSPQFSMDGAGEMSRGALPQMTQPELPQASYSHEDTVGLRKAAENAGAPAKSGNWLDIAKVWDGLGPQGKAAVIQTGGQMLAGMAQGKAREQEFKAAEDERRRKQAQFTSRAGPRPTSLAAFNEYYARRG